MRHRDVERWLSQGQRLLRQGRWAEAEEALARAVERAPEYRWPHLYLALARADAGRAEEALPEIDRALAPPPESAVLRVFRGRILCDAGRYEEALAEFERALQLDPRYAVARGYQALALLEQGEVAAARERWQAAPAEPPSPLLGRMLLAAERRARGQSADRAEVPTRCQPCDRVPAKRVEGVRPPPEEAVELPEVPEPKPVACRPARRAMAALRRARRIYFEKDRPAEALPFYLEAVRADPSLADAWQELVGVSYELGAHECVRQALERYRQAAGADENDPHYRAYLAGCEARYGDPEAALALLEGADAAQPIVPYARGLALLALDRIPEARFALIQFAEFVPRVAQRRLHALLDSEP